MRRDVIGLKEVYGGMRKDISYMAEDMELLKERVRELDEKTESATAEVEVQQHQHQPPPSEINLGQTPGSRGSPLHSGPEQMHPQRGRHNRRERAVPFPAAAGLPYRARRISRAKWHQTAEFSCQAFNKRNRRQNRVPHSPHQPRGGSTASVHRGGETRASVDARHYGKRCSKPRSNNYFNSKVKKKHKKNNKKKNNKQTTIYYTPL
ncbi:hypothetical protein ElyMa_006625100 [Elysia marginata]|uniref:Uncharacterized protein n=1 Tax=Elysia marginata TaxID=1093978 RepID=A0AAV4IGU5_9GAST|nr:hypothetical protein ElyMa_006625100 [Elysia marginata]